MLKCTQLYWSNIFKDPPLLNDNEFDFLSTEKYICMHWDREGEGREERQRLHTVGLKFRRSLSLFSLSKCVYPPANKSQMLNFRSTCSHTFPSNVAGAAAFRIRMDISKRIFVSLEKDVHSPLAAFLSSPRERREGKINLQGLRFMCSSSSSGGSKARADQPSYTVV